MTQLDLFGSIQRPLTHLALLGLADILDSQGIPDVRVHFTDEVRPRARITAAGASPEEIGVAVHDHARQRGENSWVTASMTHEDGADRAVMSPRLKPPDSVDDWARLQAARRRELDRITEAHQMLDLRMLGGLGEPAYWRCDERSSQPDQGASRWEMKTRNKGEEFVGNRLAPLARAVAARTPRLILDGLTGVTTIDETGQNAGDSRSATGFAPPGPVDSALAWCALWGLGELPVVHSGSDRSRTPGAQRWDRIHPDVMVVPVYTVPTSLPRLRAILRSAELDRQAAALIESTTDSSSSWLAEHGVRALMRFDVAKFGSASAPERRVLDGVVIPITQP